MSGKSSRASTKDFKIEIRCATDKVRRDFKRIAADFDNYEEVIKWLAKNYAMFIKVSPPEDHHVVKGNIL